MIARLAMTKPATSVPADKLETLAAFFAYAQETASHAMCHGDTYTLDEAMTALYRIHEAADNATAAASVPASPEPRSVAVGPDMSKLVGRLHAIAATSDEETGPALSETADMIWARHASELAAAREQEADWWHRNWHRDTGIPCDGTMEVCRRANDLLRTT